MHNISKNRPVQFASYHYFNPVIDLSKIGFLIESELDDKYNLKNVQLGVNPITIDGQEKYFLIKNNCVQTPFSKLKKDPFTRILEKANSNKDYYTKAGENAATYILQDSLDSPGEIKPLKTSSQIIGFFNAINKSLGKAKIELPFSKNEQLYYDSGSKTPSIIRKNGEPLYSFQIQDLFQNIQTVIEKVIKTGMEK